MLLQCPEKEVANSSSGDVSTWSGQETSLCGSEAECRVLREEIILGCLRREAPKYEVLCSPGWPQVGYVKKDEFNHVILLLLSPKC